MLADGMAVAQVFEAGMLVCFGIAWPVDIVRTLRTRRVAGKSPLFMAIILLGYVAGLTAKLVRAGAEGARPELVTGLYGLNAVLILVDIGLYYHFRRHGDTS